MTTNPTVESVSQFSSISQSFNILQNTRNMTTNPTVQFYQSVVQYTAKHTKYDEKP